MKKYKVPFENILKQQNHDESQEMKNILTKQFINNEKLEVLLGEDGNYKPIYLDMHKIGHLLIAGVPRSGKSMCLHTILASLLLKNSYEDLKLVLIDPKKVELAAYNDLPHLAMPILIEPKQAVAGLKWINEEIEKRKTLFEQIGISDFLEYERIKEKDDAIVKLPRIVIIADEYADLITQFDSKGKDALVRIVQEGASVGIHLILSTVRPTINIIFGTLKAFIPTRIAFRVATEIDSKVIIDQAGAENLKGKGDMLLKNAESLIHLQGAYIDEFEVEKICDYIRNNYSSSYLVTLEELEKMKVEVPHEEKEDEELLYQIALFCTEINNISINNIQNQFGLGFNRTVRILEELEKRGIVSKKQGTKGRELLVDIKCLKNMFNISTKPTDTNRVTQESAIASTEQEEDDIDAFLESEELIQNSENNFIEELDSKVKDILIKYDLLRCILKASRLPAMINLDFSDYIFVLKKGPIFAYCNETLTKDDLPTIINISQPKNKVDVILNVSYSDNIELNTIKKISNFFKEKFPLANIIFGTSLDNDIEKGKIGVLALFVDENK